MGIKRHATRGAIRIYDEDNVLVDEVMIHSTDVANIARTSTTTVPAIAGSLLSRVQSALEMAVEDEDITPDPPRPAVR
jgi:hypothetical protein